MTSLMELQRAIVQRLTGDPELMGMVTGVFDDVPQGQEAPYLVVGEASETAMNTFTRKGRESNLTIHIYSEYAGFKEGLTILQRLNDLLDDGEPLSLETQQLIYLLFDNVQTINGDSFKHIPVTYRAVVQE